MSRAHAPLEAEPKVTPMIDVLLVLLITFMLSVALRKAIPVQLPDPAPVVDGAIDDPIVLSVAPGPRYAINGQPVEAARLQARLAELFAPRPHKLIFVAGDRAASYQQVIAAIDAARGAGVRAIGIAPGRPGR